MLIAVLAGIGLLAGLPIGLVLAGGLAAIHPAFFLAGIGAWTLVVRVSNRRASEDREVDFLRAVRSELRAGASVRQAIGSAGPRFPDLELGRAARLAAAGAAAGQVGAELRRNLPDSGLFVASAVDTSERTGAALGPLIGRLIDRAEKLAELRRERRASSAQARLSALVVGVAPVLFTGFLMLSGAVPTPWGAGGALAAVAAVGLSLELAGFAWVVVLLRRADRRSRRWPFVLLC